MKIYDFIIEVSFSLSFKSLSLEELALLTTKYKFLFPQKASGIYQAFQYLLIFLYLGIVDADI